jgi:hypothetical protein
MKTVHKVQLEMTDEQTVEFSSAFIKPLSVQFQQGKLCLWAIVDVDKPGYYFKVIIRGTGHALDFDLAAHQFVGTVQTDGLVFHVWVQK